jgi:Tfp pilus assembly protein PilX
MTTRRFGDESGIALIAVLMLLFFMLAIGLAVTARTDSQSAQSADERTKESSFNLAEAALNAAALQLSRDWPTNSTFPSSCTAVSVSTSCPQPSAIGGGYVSKDYAQSCVTSPSTPLWQTSVRDNVAGEQSWSTAVTARGAYDGAAAAADNVVWLRSTAMVQCDRVSVVSLVSRATVPIDFPAGTLNANWFQTANQGRKVIVDTLGSYAQPPSVRPGPAAQPSPIVLRCAGLTPAQCAQYDAAKGQVQPPAVTTNSTASPSALNTSQIQSLERQASSAGTLYSGTCPTTAAQLTSVNGAPVVVQGPCDLSIGGTGSVNSATTPGVLVIENGTFSLGASANFYGLLYAVNQQGSTGSVVTILANASLQGTITVDGAGGVTAGSSKTNLSFDPRAPTLLRGYSGAVMGKNTFRVLPPSTP